MKLKLAMASMCLCLCLPCWAQGPAPAGAAGSPVAVSNPEPRRGGEPQVRRTITEDESVRVDELRVRGITRRVVVQSKLPGAPAYEIGSSVDGRDLSQDRRSEGRSLWQLFAF
ncbi:MAG: hypothetical protein ACRC2B_19390 [Rubrivivax sp.]